VFIPAIVAAALYGIGAFVIMPLIRQHRNRYSQYLPLESISQHTNSFRDRLATAVTRLVVPRNVVVIDASESRRGSTSGEEFVFGDAEGDSMVGFDVGRSDRQVRGANIGSNGRSVEEV
ncbi:hypothetical protein DOTSEDRAFT_124808, partial [Dothistroma septosporum NZE10]